MTDRDQKSGQGWLVLLYWARERAPAAFANAILEPVAGDASNRRYFRLSQRDGVADEGSANSLIVVEAPPQTEKNEAFLAIQEILVAAGIRVPAVLAVDLCRGYLLLEDLGDNLLLSQLNESSVDTWYERGLTLCQHLGRVVVSDADNYALANYDQALLSEELSRFPRWFCEALLNYFFTPDESEIAAKLFGLLIDSALEQPQVLVHRDFHSRNLMIDKDDELAVIDFQDAVRGPLTYDVVSLLRDCYIRWPRPQVEAWALAYRNRLRAANLIEAVDELQFLRWFDLMGLQRHLKVLGTFARLYLRDGKHGYLADLPRVCAYVEEVLALYAPQLPAVAAFQHWWREHLLPLMADQPWMQIK
ncbi:MAG: aminoglycoside phosphotransferase family protein [Parahaliea sp.]